MKIKDIFEAQESIGVVVAVSNGKFYDINFVDYNTLDPLPVPGYVSNLGKNFIDTVKEYEAWNNVFPFFKKHYQSRPLGEEYHAEDADFFLFGPLSVRDLEGIGDLFIRETYGESM